MTSKLGLMKSNERHMLVVSQPQGAADSVVLQLDMARISDGMALFLMGSISVATIFAVLATSSLKKAVKLSIEQRLDSLHAQPPTKPKE